MVAILLTKAQAETAVRGEAAPEADQPQDPQEADRVRLRQVRVRSLVFVSLPFQGALDDIEVV